MANDCVFCKIVRGDLPALKIYEDSKSLAFLDIHPVNPGHTLVIPKADNTQNIFDVSADDWMAATDMARKVARALESALSADGVNIMMNNRAHAGQVIFHPHIHVIPRFRGDSLPQWRHGSYREGEAEDILKKVSTAMQ